MKTIILIPTFIFVLGLIPQWGKAQFESKPLPTLKQEARAQLLKRKQGFDQYMDSKADRDKLRLAQAFKMKSIRQSYAEKQEKARKSFMRKTEPFPRKEYEAFLQRREKRHKELESDRKDYVAVQRELDAIFENKKYRIDGNKEFDL